MSIAQNKKAFHDFFIEEKYEAGIVLEGWEVKAIRDNRTNIKEAYVIIQRGESIFDWLSRHAHGRSVHPYSPRCHSNAQATFT